MVILSLFFSLYVQVDCCLEQHIGHIIVGRRVRFVVQHAAVVQIHLLVVHHLWLATHVGVDVLIDNVRRRRPHERRADNLLHGQRVRHRRLLLQVAVLQRRLAHLLRLVMIVLLLVEHLLLQLELLLLQGGRLGGHHLLDVVHGVLDLDRIALRQQADVAQGVSRRRCVDATCGRTDAGAGQQRRWHTDEH